MVKVRSIGRNFLKFLPGKINSLGKARLSWSQSGEDLIVDSIFRSLKTKPVYLDVGASHPFSLSNTYFFYKKGFHGICVEPDPDVYKKLYTSRKSDICLNAGVKSSCDDDDIQKLYIISSSVLNTFSKEEAERIVSNNNYTIKNIIDVPMISINNILNGDYGIVPNYLSIDVEGNDLGVIHSIDFTYYKPAVICVETLEFTEDNHEKKKCNMSEFLTNNGYFQYADTYINTIFVRTDDWANRGR